MLAYACGTALVSLEFSVGETPKLQVIPVSTSLKGSDEMSNNEYEHAIQSLMRAFARGESIPRNVLMASGYDVQVMEYCMEVVRPELNFLPGYKPLVLWLRQREGIHVRSEQKLDDYKHVIEILKLYVNVNQPGDKIYTVQTVGSYVSRDGEYFVTITEKPDALKQELCTNELDTRLIRCTTATELAEILNPLKLQRDPYHDYDERFRILSPLTTITSNLYALCKKRRDDLSSKSENLDKVMTTMEIAIRKT